MATAKVLDFSKVRDGGRFTRLHMKPGDYRAVIASVEDTESQDEKKPMWLFSIQLVDRPRAVYPYYCTFESKTLWKIRNLVAATGMSVPKKKLKVDPTKLVGKEIGLTLDDDEYEGKMRSEITAIFPLSELAPAAEEDEDLDEVEQDDEEEEEEEEQPKRRSKSKKKSRKAVDEDEDDDDEEVEEEELEELEIDDL